MIVAIIAGGSGTRLWPLSTPEYPKHLLAVSDSEHSLLQLTYRRAKSLSDKIYILTESSHSDFVKKQLPDLPEEHVIIEPARRGTASCIMLGLHHIKQQNKDVSEPVIFFHADHHITDIEGFAITAKTAVQASIDEQKITLIGIEPRYAATGFGYIKKGERAPDGRDLPVYKVSEFKEKPDHNTAQKYYASGQYLWNMGLFAAPINVYERSVEKYNPALYKNYTKLGENADTNKIYKDFSEEAIDTALIERDKDLLVVPGSFGWADIGSFLDLYHVVEQNDDGNYLDGSVKVVDSQNNYLHNKDNKPLVVIGMDNIVVVNTPDGVLVCRRDQAQKVGNAIKEFKKEQNPKN